MSWVLMRGLTREARHWGSFHGQFSSALGTEAPVLLDLPGNGVFHKQRSAASVRAMVEFARARLRDQGLQPPWRLLAMSLGGMVATDWAQRYPQEVARLVLINTSMRPFSRMTDRLRPGPGLQTWRGLAQLAWHWRRIDEAERLIHELTCQHTGNRQDDVAAWHRIRQSAPVSAANALRQLWAAARFLPPPPHRPAPRCCCRPQGMVSCIRAAQTHWPAPGAPAIRSTPGPVTTCRMTTPAGYASVLPSGWTDPDLLLF